MVAISRTDLARLTPDGYINRDQATDLLKNFYEPAAITRRIGFLWSALTSLAVQGKVPFDGFCVLCDRHVSTRTRFAAHRGCGLEMERPYDTLVFRVESLMENAPLFFDGIPHKKIGETTEQSFARLVRAIREDRTGNAE